MRLFMTCDIQLREMVQELLLQVKLYILLASKLLLAKGTSEGMGAGLGV
jgi:hypothetical protein